MGQKIYAILPVCYHSQHVYMFIYIYIYIYMYIYIYIYIVKYAVHYFNLFIKTS